VKDQTLSGSAASGSGLGELDIKIEDERGRAVSIIEALNLDSCKTGVIENHILKVLRHYDSSGLKENYILVYGEAKDFVGLCKKYRAHLDHIDYESYALHGEIETVATGFHKMAAFRARHRCNEGETVLNHILVEM
jgi:hypothetical protein